jgi:galactokinase
LEVKEVYDGFFNIYGRNMHPPRLFFAPGRVNLIGEHTDYNGGYVFPCALSLGTYGVIRKRDDNCINLAAAGFEPMVNITTDTLRYDPTHGWANYVKAVAHELTQMGYLLNGFDLYVCGNLPSGAGLSSSASVELMTGVALKTIFDLCIEPIEMVKLCQRAENNYIGVNCGIMDQFASGMGKKDHAILLDCNTLSYQYVPIVLGDYVIIIANTNCKRGLSDSKYNKRRAECEEALADLKKIKDVNALCLLDPSTFDKNEDKIKNPIARKRAAHAVYENARTLLAVDALSKGNLKSFGKLMNASHVSLRDLYEVTGPELDALAEAAWGSEWALGSRMTGAGFGGCTVNLVEAKKANGFIKNVSADYTARTGLEADFYIAETGDGAREIKEEEP